MIYGELLQVILVLDGCNTSALYTHSTPGNRHLARVEVSPCCGNKHGSVQLNSQNDGGKLIHPTLCIFTPRSRLNQVQRMKVGAKVVVVGIVEEPARALSRKGYRAYASH
jgi:hypothetical protein